MRTIESVQNTLIKERAKLKLKKERDRSGLFLVQGRHMTEEAHQAGCLIEVFCADDPGLDDVEWIRCPQAVLDKLSVQNSPAQIIGTCKKPSFAPARPQRILCLDRIQDPGNLGTLIRTAYAMGIEEVLCSQGCTDLYNPKTLQSSQGAFFHLPVQTVDLQKAVRTLKEENIPVFATGLHKKSTGLHNVIPPKAYALILGNEGSGVTEELIEAADHNIVIEMARFESLNVATAGGILLWYFYCGNCR